MPPTRYSLYPLQNLLKGAYYLRHFFTNRKLDFALTCVILIVQCYIYIGYIFRFSYSVYYILLTSLSILVLLSELVNLCMPPYFTFQIFNSVIIIKVQHYQYSFFIDTRINKLQKIKASSKEVTHKLSTIIKCMCYRLLKLT